MNIKPLSDRVLVEPAQAETKTASGIIIPDTAQEKPQKGTIIAVGNGKVDEPLTVKIGDTVLYNDIHAGSKINNIEVEVDDANINFLNSNGKDITVDYEISASNNEHIKRCIMCNM